ncbi:MAG: hypothetical protein RMK84_09790 [Oscillochloridaceae bacterium]|nr:hypothetical protein [Chloroflexaceae bacterium]MDW8390405.1 hypothetical protein [Oscillochloridaceae bacterium]
MSSPPSPRASPQHLAKPPNRFAETPRRLARRGRPALLRDLTAPAPRIVALGERRGQPAVAALAPAIVKTGRCWE